MSIRSRRDAHRRTHPPAAIPVPVPGPLFLAAVGGGVLVQTAAVWLAAPGLALAGLVVGAVVDGASWAEATEVEGRLRRTGLNLLVRATVRAVLFVAAFVPGVAPARVPVVAYTVGVGAIVVASRGVAYLLGRVVSLRPAEGVRNVGADLALHGFFDRVRDHRKLLPAAITAAEVPLAVGLWLATRSALAGTIVLVVTIVLLGVTLAAALVWTRRFERSGAVERYVEDLETAVAATGAQVVVYFSGGRDATYQLRQWMPVVERLERPVLVLLREPWHLDELEPTRWPVLVARRHRDVEVALAADPKVVLYVAQAGRNVHFLRYARPKHVFLNHGDSDKASSANPVVRAYDRLFVAGQVAIDRYRDAGIDLTDERFAVVGRPQLDDVLTGGQRIGDGPTTVLYAPTWEGFFETADYSSLERSGEAIVRDLLERHPDVRIVYKPHPASGSVRPAAGIAARRVESLLREAGGPHLIAADHPELDLLDWFDRSDLLIADISAVVTDWLQTDKPYLVTNPRGLPPDDFRRRFPSHRAAYVVAADLGNLDAQLEEALGSDPLADERRRMKVAVLGEHPDGPFAAFVRALDDVVADAERDAAHVVNTFEHERS